MASPNRQFKTGNELFALIKDFDDPDCNNNEVDYSQLDDIDENDNEMNAHEDEDSENKVEEEGEDEHFVFVEEDDEDEENVHLVGLDIFTNKKFEDLCPSTHNIDVPNVNRCYFQLIDISDDGFVTLMNDKGETRDDIRIPEGELGQKIRDDFGKEGITVIVTVLLPVGEEAIVACKNAS